MDTGGTKTAAIVVAGGASRRMGQDKATMWLQNKPMLLHVVEAILPLNLDAIWVLVNPSQSLDFLPANCSIYRDRLPHQGPMISLAEFLREREWPFTATFLLGCDSPFISATFLGYLLQQLPGYDVAIPRIDNQLYPLHAVYTSWALQQFATVAKSGQKSMHAVLDTCHCNKITQQQIATIEPSLQSLWNLNLPEDIERIQQFISE